MVDELVCNWWPFSIPICHADHVTGAWLMQQATRCHRHFTTLRRCPGADLHLEHGDRIAFGSPPSRCPATPGHTVGFRLSYVGDDRSLVFHRRQLDDRQCRSLRFVKGDAHILYRSITEQLFTLPADCLILPAHDYSGRTASSVGEEQAYNPASGQADERDFVGFMENLNLPHPKQLISRCRPTSVRGRPEDGRFPSLPTGRRCARLHWRIPRDRFRVGFRAPCEFRFSTFCSRAGTWRRLCSHRRCVVHPLAELKDSLERVPRSGPWSRSATRGCALAGNGAVAPGGLGAGGQSARRHAGLAAQAGTAAADRPADRAGRSFICAAGLRPVLGAPNRRRYSWLNWEGSGPPAGRRWRHPRFGQQQAPGFLQAECFGTEGLMAVRALKWVVQGRSAHIGPGRPGHRWTAAGGIVQTQPMARATRCPGCPPAGCDAGGRPPPTSRRYRIPARQGRHRMSRGASTRRARRHGFGQTFVGRLTPMPGVVAPLEPAARDPQQFANLTQTRSSTAHRSGLSGEASTTCAITGGPPKSAGNAVCQTYFVSQG